MKGVKICTIVLLIAALAAGVFVYWQFQSAKIEVIQVQTRGIVASEEAEAFAEWTAAAQANRFIGTCFQKPDAWNGAEQYAFVTYSVTLRNGSFLPIEQIELQVSPKTDDYLQIGSSETYRLNSGEVRTIESVVLCNRGSDTVRDLKLSWYLWGKPYVLDVKCGG